MRKYSLVLVGICVFVFILQISFPFIEDNFALYSSRVFSEPWLLVTSIFLHGSFQHLFFNMFALGLFGFITENIIGSKKFIQIYLLSGIVASVGAAIFYPAALGASGAIYGIMGTLAVLRPKMRIWIMGFFPMPMYMAAIVWAGMDLLGMFAPSGTANAAHLFGLGAGIVAGFILRGDFRLPKRRNDPLSESDRKRIETYFDRLDKF